MQEMVGNAKQPGKNLPGCLLLTAGGLAGFSGWCKPSVWFCSFYRVDGTFCGLSTLPVLWCCPNRRPSRHWHQQRWHRRSCETNWRCGNRWRVCGNLRGRHFWRRQSTCSHRTSRGLLLTGKRQWRRNYPRGRWRWMQKERPWT